MIVPDINLLIYAHNESLPQHEAAREWFRGVMTGSEPVGFASVVILGFVRILSSSAVVARPARPEDLLAVAGRWLERPVAQRVEAAADYPKVMRHLFARTGAGAKLTTDFYLAAVAISHGAVLHSNDSDFHRVDGLNVVNPLQDGGMATG